jgi:hypothetical protein
MHHRLKLCLNHFTRYIWSVSTSIIHIVLHVVYFTLFSLKVRWRPIINICEDWSIKNKERWMHGMYIIRLYWNSICLRGIRFDPYSNLDIQFSIRIRLCSYLYTQNWIFKMSMSFKSYPSQLDYAIIRIGFRQITIKYKGFVQVPLSTETPTLKYHLII